MSEMQLNRLLAMLPPPVLERLGNAASVVSAFPGELLQECGEPVVDVYFPLDLVTSLEQVITHDAQGGASAPGVALAGNEGVIGIEAMLGAESAINRATVRIGGRAVRVSARALIEEFGRGGVVHRLVLGSADALIGQSCAIGACERIHSVRQRVIRWLLMFADRAPPDDMRLTQDSLAQLLGVRRPSISTAAGQLQADGLIAYQRGSVMISDRERLEASACRCYREIKARYSFLLDA